MDGWQDVATEVLVQQVLLRCSLALSGGLEVNTNSGPSYIIGPWGLGSNVSW